MPPLLQIGYKIQITMYAMEFHEKEILINAFTFKSFHAHYKRKILSFGLLYAGNVCNL